MSAGTTTVNGFASAVEQATRMTAVRQASKNARSTASGGPYASLTAVPETETIIMLLPTVS